MYGTPCTEHKLFVTLLSISTLLLFATLSGVYHYENMQHRISLGKVPEPVGSRNFERQEQDLAIGDSVGLRKSSSLFELLSYY